MSLVCLAHYVIELFTWLTCRTAFWANKLMMMMTMIFARYRNTRIVTYTVLQSCSCSANERSAPAQHVSPGRLQIVPPCAQRDDWSWAILPDWYDDCMRLPKSHRGRLVAAPQAWYQLQTELTLMHSMPAFKRSLNIFCSRLPIRYRTKLDCQWKVSSF